jgi:hypothetical protein
MGERRGTHRFWWGNLRERGHVEDPVEDNMKKDHQEVGFNIRLNPSTESSLKIIHSIMDILHPYQEMFEQLKRQGRQLPITMFFKRT